VKETAQGAIVELRMPELSIPVLRYDHATSPWSGLRDLEQLHVQMEVGARFLRGWMWRPGLVLFRPMAPATVTIRCVWPQGRDFVNRVKGPLALEPGVCEIRWEPEAGAAR